MLLHLQKIDWENDDNVPLRRYSKTLLDLKSKTQFVHAVKWQERYLANNYDSVDTVNHMSSKRW